ncbi:TPA: hypothetical protein ROY04_005309 [Bacillus cereus]|nr:hypothetical protein [Bacillus cereus]
MRSLLFHLHRLLVLIHVSFNRSQLQRRVNVDDEPIGQSLLLPFSHP